MVELDRLSHGSKDRHYDSPEHAEMLRNGAQKAVTFLENGFDTRNSHLRALTAEGTTLDTITFRCEELKDLVSHRPVTLNNASDYQANGLLSDYIGWTNWLTD